MRGDMDTRRFVIVLALPLAIALAASNLGCSPEVPAMPTYTSDVRPILMAHCVRCHGANDMLNANPDLAGRTLTMPMTCYLQRFEDMGDCTTTGSTTCRHGAGYCGTLMGTESLITSRVLLPEGDVRRMPPPPADPLNDWEKEVLTRWSSAAPAQ
jgi:hypothetical protein